MNSFTEGNTYLIIHPQLPNDTLEMVYKGFFKSPGSDIKNHMFEGSGVLFTLTAENIGNAPVKISVTAANHDPIHIPNNQNGGRKRHQRKTRRHRKTRHRRRTSRV